MSRADDAPRSDLGAPESGEVTETGRLLGEFLHVAAEVRRGPEQRHPEVDDPADPAGDPLPVSSHALRAAIYIHRRGAQTVGELAANLGVSSGWVSRVVEELRTGGYVVRERDPQDRRVVRVRIRPEAVAAVERSLRWRNDTVFHALEPLSTGERRAVRLFLRRLVDAIAAHDPDAARGSERTGPES